jgi:hypothetical protein
MLNRIEKDAEKKKSEVDSTQISENYHKENSNKDLLVRSSIGGGAEKQKSEIYFSTHFLGIIMNKDMIPSLPEQTNIFKNARKHYRNLSRVWMVIAVPDCEPVTVRKMRRENGYFLR